MGNETGEISLFYPETYLENLELKFFLVAERLLTLYQSAFSTETAIYTTDQNDNIYLIG